MEAQFHCEIHFYQQYQASILIQSDIGGEDKSLGETILFCAFALRQMHNLREVGAYLARVLSVGGGSAAAGSYAGFFGEMNSMKSLAVHAPFMLALGVEPAELLQYLAIPELALAKATSAHDNKAIAAELWPDVARVVDRRISAGKKRFISDLEIRPDKALLQLKPYGFGILGREVNWYASMSVVMLFMYLLEQRAKDYDLSRILEKSAKSCGQAFLDHAVSSLSILELPLKIAHQHHFSN